MKRRDFLKLIGMGTAASVALAQVPSIAQAVAPEPEDVFRDGENVYVLARASGPVHPGDFVAWIDDHTVERFTEESVGRIGVTAGNPSPGGMCWVCIYGTVTANFDGEDRHLAPVHHRKRR